MSTSSNSENLKIDNLIGDFNNRLQVINSSVELEIIKPEVRNRFLEYVIEKSIKELNT